MTQRSGTAQEFSYEADSNGNVYERWNGSAWPTGIRVRAWASRTDITQDEFYRHLRELDWRES